MLPGNFPVFIWARRFHSAVAVIPINKNTTPSKSSLFMCGSSSLLSPLLLRLERSHIDREAVLDIGPEQSLVSFVHLLDRDDFNIGGDVVLPAEIEHLLSFGDAANV